MDLINSFLNNHQQLLTFVLTFSSNSMFIVDEQGIIRYVNPEAERAFGYPITDLAGQSSHRFFSPAEETNQVKAFHGQHRDGTALLLEGHILEWQETDQRYSLYLFYQNTTTLSPCSEIETALSEAEAKFKEKQTYLAFHDPLTSLPNRRYLDGRLQEILQENRHQKIMILYMDLDRFKDVNDNLGHHAGDLLLQEISVRLQSVIEEQDFIAHMGGDEFVILHPLSSGEEEVVSYAQKMLSGLEVPFNSGDYEIYLTASIGVSMFPVDGVDPATLMKNADVALHRAKDQGNTYQVYTPSMNVKSFQTFMLKRDLRKALTRNEFEVYYQPRVDAVTNQILRAEALIRWNHPELGMVSPADFIPIAETSGLILAIGSWVKRNVCEQIVSWRKRGLPTVPISVNISAQRLMQKDFVSDVQDLLEEFHLEGSCLEFEITESSLLKNEEFVTGSLAALKEMGIKISIDDFGTGYSSFSYLKQFSINSLKIDRSFIHGITDDSENAAITAAMIKMAQQLNLSVVAEGVETLEELHFLRKQNCNEIQGYLFSRPLPVSEFEKVMQVGKLDPKVRSNEATPNRRSYDRLYLSVPLEAKMRIVRFHDREVQIGKTKVLIENIGLGGLKFLTPLSMIIHPGMTFEMETEILGETLNFYGRIIWQQEGEDGLYHYGLAFTMDESQREPMIQILDQFAKKLQEQARVPGSSHISVPKVRYFTKNKKIKK